MGGVGYVVVFLLIVPFTKLPNIFQLTKKDCKNMSLGRTHIYVLLLIKELWEQSSFLVFFSLLSEKYRNLFENTDSIGQNPNIE